MGIYLGELLMVGLFASSLGVALAFALQAGVGFLLEKTLKLAIPQAGWVPALQGYAVGLVVSLAFGASATMDLSPETLNRTIQRSGSGDERSRHGG